MTNLQNYNDDGANYQAKAVLAFLQPHTIEKSWDANSNSYSVIPQVARWENGREDGYVIVLRVGQNQLNIAFFEHRNSDSICAVRWEQCTRNAPTIENAEFGDVYKTKWDVSFEVSYGEICKMSQWITQELDAFYIANVSKKETV